MVGAALLYFAVRGISEGRAAVAFRHGHDILTLETRIGLVIFATYPLAPPRLLDVGLQDTVTNFPTSYRALQPPALINKYAALPSLHLGWNLLVGIAVYRTDRRPALRIFAVTGPILMAWAVVATANHYILDTLVGATVALVGLAGSTWMTPRLVARYGR